ncbi:YraN family protein [Leptolyngbya sp. PCC 6406]|uniref:YraN family protein n=1 Tax=Leptolyngbya sp. PCC 6406 TaxID=1173264 RepID=UPI0002AC3A3E|nr:YraN family protein [Leptolyngbya sp. PCC 6406]
MARRNADSNDRLEAAQRLGELGEALVADWLRQQGWRVVAQRWHCRWGELDIIAMAFGRSETIASDPDPNLAFVEVKSRRQGSLDRIGRLAITPQKQQKLWRSAEVFLAQMPQYAELPCRFDVALVEQGPLGRSTGLMQRAIADGGYTLTLVDYIVNAFDGS